MGASLATHAFLYSHREQNEDPKSGIMAEESAIFKALPLSSLLRKDGWCGERKRAGSILRGGERPHGGVRHVRQKSTCTTRLTLRRYVVQIWSRSGRNFDPTKPAYSTEW